MKKCDEINKTKLSIILSVNDCTKCSYNDLDCILNQTFKNIEILCLYNNSNEKSDSIFEKYAKDDERINIIKNVSQELVFAKNAALEEAKGEFISFFNLGDFIPKDYYENLLNAIKNENADIAQSRYSIIQKDKKDNYSLKGIEQESRNPNFANRLILAYSSLPICNKIYKKEVLSNICFKEKTTPYEDNLFVFETFTKAKKIITVAEICYNSSEFNCVHRRFEKNPFQLLKSADFLIDYLNNPKNKINKKEQKDFYPLLINSFNTAYNYIPSDTNVNRKNKKQLRKIQYRLMFKMKYLPLADKFGYEKEFLALKKHLNKFLAPFKIIEIILKIIKNILLLPCYFFKEGMTNK